MSENPSEAAECEGSFVYVGFWSSWWEAGGGEGAGERRGLNCFQNLLKAFGWRSSLVHGTTPIAANWTKGPVCRDSHTGRPGRKSETMEFPHLSRFSSEANRGFPIATNNQAALFPAV